LPIINHAEDVCLRSDGLMHEGLVSTNLGLPGNPDFAESVMIHRDLELASFTGSKIHIPHVSAQKSVAQILKFKTKFKNISSEVTPHHLYFNDEALSSFDTNFKVAPPIRTEYDRLSLIEGLKTGVIDCIATDHAPHTLEEKETTFDLASCGMIGLESCFGAVNKVLVYQSKIKLISLIKFLTTNPRDVMGFDNNLFSYKKTAEIVILDEKKKWKFTKDSIKSNSLNSPFIGEELIGRIEFTISKNQIYSRTKLDI
jgi:dihydroorotase